ncbi:hypothetical protein [Delftia phage PhiW-14]|uniref:Uncharacterized protein n=1 Tax=Delftia phage PhiW-14 TaxID=665032 RepID=C9DGD9_BPW14|nr:hypothetical protein DP-phiW-14_gp169 [Delftia phage PhiW-14]ACV50190.1 hypothetical protein [Delftia phage PhiW-14]
MITMAALSINNTIVLKKVFAKRPDDTQLETWLEDNWSVTRPHWKDIRDLIEQLVSKSKNVSVKQGVVTLMLV